MDPDAVAKAFVEHIYRTFDTNRAALGGLYQDASMLTFEGDKRKAYVSPLPAVRACHLHRRLPAIRPRRRHASLRQRFPSARWRVARTQVQPDVSANGNTSRKLLCAE